MPRIEFSEAQLISTLRAVVNEQPEHVYTAPEYMRQEDQGNECFYVHVDENGDNPEPGCIWGHVLNRLGVPLEVLAGHEGASIFVLLSLISKARLSADIRIMASTVQTAQDDGANWREALAAASDRGMI